MKKYRWNKKTFFKNMIYLLLIGCLVVGAICYLYICCTNLKSL